ncbi:MAG: hypothetical protein DRQ55_09910 [Planctomycetota bacterium]|nr:MAG: hypothetical protein DRQ55_09910 [Planctomycetota bacterium]
MLNRDFSDLLSAFADCGVEYLLIGAHALSVHGFVRATGDLDVWVRPSRENAGAVCKALRAFGAPAEMFTEDDLVQPDQVLQLGVAPVRIDILTSISGVTFDEAWGARMEVLVEGQSVSVLSREHLIINKQATGRPQDLIDVDRLTQGDAGRGERGGE